MLIISVHPIIILQFEKICQAYYTQTNPSTPPLTSFGDSFWVIVFVYFWPGILRVKPTLRFAPFRLASLKIIYISFTQLLFFNEAGRNEMKAGFDLFYSI